VQRLEYKSLHLLSSAKRAMKPRYLQVSKNLISSFFVRKADISDVTLFWNYHPELELVYIKKGSGIGFIGQQVVNFGEGSVFLIGPYLPHFFRFDDCYFDDNLSFPVEVIVIHFAANCLGSAFMHLPENSVIAQMIAQAHYGWHLAGTPDHYIGQMMATLDDLIGVPRIAAFLRLLMEISGERRFLQLNQTFEVVHARPDDRFRINTIYEYCFLHFKEPVKITEISKIAGISRNSFCRFFKAHTKKTFSLFMIGIRVSHACTLLIQSELTVKEACFASGFNNLASFHKYFKLITGQTPTVYQRAFVKKSFII
jgi:AraC-like DNA-binding protein